MTQDEVIQWAREAGMELYNLGRNKENLETFAFLAFEAGRQQGMKQERALWLLAETSKEIGEQK